MRAVLEAIAPARLGSRFRWLLAASWASNLADGMLVASGPLLVASQTTNPFLVASAAFLQRLPWLLFGLIAGVVADRVDRRLVVMAANLLRAVVVTVVALTVLGHVISTGVVLGVVFFLGVAETLTDVSTDTVLPMVVDKADLGFGNSRLIFGFITTNQLIGPPIGAALFAAGMASPFAAQAVLFAAGALLVSRVGALPPTDTPSEHHVVRQILDGMRWLWRHSAMRTLTITIVTFNVTFGAAWSVLVLWSAQRLGLGAFGFGFLTTTSALGGVLGAWAYPRVERNVSLGNIMRVGLIIETVTHLTLALTTTPWVAFVILGLFGVHTAFWGTTATSVRQRAVPTEFQGRVSSVYMIGVQGGMLVGTLLGGVIADRGTITDPFWFAFVGSAVILVLIWRSLGQIAHD